MPLCFLGFLPPVLDESDVTVLAFLPRDHRSLRNYVGDDDIKAGRVLLITLPPGLPGVSADPAVTRFTNLNHIRTTRRRVVTDINLVT